MRYDNDIDGIIFDLNGVLVDSEKLHNEAFMSAIKHVGRLTAWGDKKLEIDEESINKTIGLPTVERAEVLFKGLINPNKIKKVKDDFMMNLISKNIKSSKKINEMLEYLKDGYKLAIATDCDKRTAMALLVYSDIDHYFDAIVTRDDVGGLLKPNPFIYSEAAVRIGITPSRCIAIDNSGDGIISAIDAGCKTYKTNYKMISKMFLDSRLKSLMIRI